MLSSVSFLRGCCSGAGSAAVSWWEVIAFASLWAIWFDFAFFFFFLNTLFKKDFAYYTVLYLNA